MALYRKGPLDVSLILRQSHRRQALGPQRHPPRTLPTWDALASLDEA